jgi:hypothetical protein
VLASAPPASGNVVVVSGMVYNEAGATVDGATVTFRSLDKAVPYSATVKTAAGSYVANDVPEGVNVEAVVTKSGWTTRRRVQSFQQRATGEKNTLNFGYVRVTAPAEPLAPAYRVLEAETTLPDGAAYFISDYPEIAETTPEHDTKGLDPSKLVIKVTLSEPLDADSRNAFDDAFHIVPANAAAAGPVEDEELLDVAGRENALNDEDDDGAEATLATFPYTLNDGDTFMSSSRNRVRATWNTAGTEVVYAFEGGNLKTDDSEPAEYQAILFAGTEKIQDADGNQLGTDGDGGFQRPEQGLPLFNVFKDLELALTPDIGIVGYSLAHAPGATNWGETHQTAVAFAFKKDEVEPKLTGVELVEGDDDVRIVFTFSEPLAAFKGSGQATIDDSVYDLANYTFMVGVDAGDLDGQELSGGISNLSAKDLDAEDGLPTLTAEREFRFKADASIGYNTGTGLAPGDKGGIGKDLEGATEATAAIEVDPDMPNTVNLWIRNGAGMFDDFRVLKARVEGVTDPAGNAIGATDADRNMVSAKI